MRRLLSGMAALSLVALATPVLAQAPASSSVQAPSKLNDGGLRNRAPLSEADYVAGLTANLRAMDANGDGQVTIEERRAARDGRRARQLDERFTRLDTNADGVISREEFVSGGQAHRGRPRARQPGPAQTFDIAVVEQTARTNFARMDTNQDGQLTFEERRAGRQSLRAQRAGEGERRSRGRHAAGHNGGPRARQASPSTPVSE